MNTQSLHTPLSPDFALMPDALTHKELVIRAERWLRNTIGCSVVLAELVTNAGEVPDAIGWKSGTSTLVECKVSRSDFFRDAAKMGRQTGMHMGDMCYYMTPPSLVTQEEVPFYWGLIEVHGRTVKVAKRAAVRPAKTPDELHCACTRQAREIMILVSALRRAMEVV